MKNLSYFGQIKNITFSFSIAYKKNKKSKKKKKIKIYTRNFKKKSKFNTIFSKLKKNHILFLFFLASHIKEFKKKKKNKTYL